MVTWPETVSHLFFVLALDSLVAAVCFFILGRHWFLLTGSIDRHDFGVLHCLLACFYQCGCGSESPKQRSERHRQEEQEFVAAQRDSSNLFIARCSAGSVTSTPIGSRLGSGSVVTSAAAAAAGSHGKGNSLPPSPRSVAPSVPITRVDTPPAISRMVSQSFSDLIHSLESKNKPQAQLADIHQKVAFHCTLLSVVLFTASVSVDLIKRLSNDGVRVLPLSMCAYVFRVTTSLWYLAKSAMYLVFTARLELGFRDSIYGYSHWVIYSLYGYVVLIALATIPAVVLLVPPGEQENAFNQERDRESSSLNVCRSKPDIRLTGVAAANDVFITILFVTLFSRALNKLFQRLGRNSIRDGFDANSQISPEMRLLPLKYTVISSVAVISTMVSLVLLVILRWEFLFYVDCLINSCCLLLMSKLWKPLYFWMCAPCLRCAVGCPLCSCSDANLGGIVKTVIETNQRELIEHQRTQTDSSLTPAQRVMQLWGTLDLSVVTEDLAEADDTFVEDSDIMVGMPIP